MSYRIVGHSPDGHRIVIDEGPNTAKVRARGGLALGQALTATPASEMRPVGELVTPALRGAVLDASQRRKR